MLLGVPASRERPRRPPLWLAGLPVFGRVVAPLGAIPAAPTNAKTARRVVLKVTVTGPRITAAVAEVVDSAARGLLIVGTS